MKLAKPLLSTFSLVLLFSALVFSAQAASACSRPSVAGGTQVIQPGKAINQALLDRAIMVEVNYNRCRAGLRPVGPNTRLRNIAIHHSKWMARARKLSHTGNKTSAQRIIGTGIPLTRGGENIGMVHRYRLDNQRFIIKSAAQCRFALNGRIVPPHSYRSLARSIVDFWMASPGHRANILNRRVTQLGSGAALDARAEFCGKIYVTQDFAG